MKYLVVMRRVIYEEFEVEVEEATSVVDAMDRVDESFQRKDYDSDYITTRETDWAVASVKEIKNE